MRKSRKYIFQEVLQCEMCGSPTDKHKVNGQCLNQSQGLKPKTKVGISVSVLRCTNCGLHYSSPLPIPENISDHYGIPPESYWHESYFTPPPSNAFSVQIDTAKRFSDNKSNLIALDNGAGLCKAMIALNNAGFVAYGFELYGPFYKRVIAKMNIPENRLKCGMIEEVNYGPASFDFINFEAVAEHLYHPAKSIKRALQWLKEGLYILRFHHQTILYPSLLITITD